MHAGDVTPDDTWGVLTHDPAAVLVDVRTRAEWMFVGVPDLGTTGKPPVFIEWQHADGSTNPRFVEDLVASGVDPTAPVYFICRSGARSAAAASAATSAGFERAHNVADGFEGPPDGSRRRGTLAGWKARGLPWVQS